MLQTRFNKALVPVAVGVILFLLAKLGVTTDMTINEAVSAIATLAVTAIGVYLVPNSKK